jgi:HlyD family type I secretion membrane fusion protein
MQEVWSPSQPLRRGFALLTLGLGGFLAWSLMAELSGAVIASGHVTVAARQQAIQHPDGGVVAAIHVRDGERVDQGDPILTLEGADLHAERSMLQREFGEALARLDRLKAEVAERPNIVWRDELVRLTADLPDLQAALEEEANLFDARQDTLARTDAQIDERIAQSEAAITGRSRQLVAARRQLALLQDQFERQTKLLSGGLTEASRVSTIEQELARLEGEVGELEAGLAELKSTIAGVEAERLRLRSVFLETVQGELRELQLREAELRQRLAHLEGKIRRLTLRAPMAGSILGLKAHTLGGVIAAGAEIATIVPAGTPFEFIVEIDPGQVDRVQVGQEAVVRFPSFNARTTPDLAGRVEIVAADAIIDPATGRRMFTAELSIAQESLAQLGNLRLQPGLPIEAFITTDARTPASFLIKPMADYWAYAMREE